MSVHNPLSNMKNLIFLTVAALVVMQVTGLMEICKEDTDCNAKNSERCQKFDACKAGICVCKEGFYTWTQTTTAGGSSIPPTGLSGVCLEFLKVGATCNNGTGNCGTNVKCWNGACTCISGHYTETSDGFSCKKAKSDSFHGDGDSCSAPFFSGVCSGGTTCKSGTCKCPDNSKWMSEFNFCMHDKSETGLVEGERCNSMFFEANEYSTSFAASPQQVCKKDMYCGNCPEDMYKSPYEKKTCLIASWNGASAMQMNAVVALLLTLLASLC